MEDRRFDDLTRGLGAATSRRRVLKGLIGGLTAAIIGSVAGPAARAAGETCSSAEVQACLDKVTAQHGGLSDLCKTTDGPQWTGSACSLAADLWYDRAVARCQATQCPPGESCVDNRCCSGPDCCQTGQVYCPGSTFGSSRGMCCPAGSTCCANGCCPAEKSCCINFDYGIGRFSSEQVCVNLETDPNNCGACRHKCHGIPCIDGTCQCAAGDSICRGPLNQTCCHANERCTINPITFTVSCAPVCGDCETYNPRTGACDPTDCGTGGICCKNTCMDACPPGTTLDDATCTCAGTGGGYGGCPPCSTLGASGCEPDPTTDGQMCGACGVCHSGTCQPDPKRSCPACHTCEAGGTCAQVDDNTACGSNAVCCQGNCTAGTSCAPCPQGQHQCPDADGSYTCCPDGQDCCGGTTGYTTCGPTDGVCCTPVTTFQCGTDCCDVDNEQCLHAFSNPADQNSTIISGCCPNDAVGLLPDGTCCPAGRQMCGANNDVCCPSGKQCTQGGGAYSDVLVCCDSGTMGVLPDGTCCPPQQMANHCSSGWVCCDVSVSDETCCGCAPGQVVQYCPTSDNDTIAVCCDPGGSCC